MKLSDIISHFNELEVVNDCYIDALGMATSDYKCQKVLTFLSDVKYFKSILKNPNIKAIITKRETLELIDIPSSLGLILSENPKESFFRIHNMLTERDFYWDKFSNEIAKSSNISERAYIGEHSVKIGGNSIIEPNVVIHPGTIIGNNVIIRSGSQIGTNGFQFANMGKVVSSVMTAGKVIVNDNVEIQHNCCIDRGIFGGDTVLEEDVKIDNLVHIGHDNIIGKRTYITAGVKLAGRVTIGKDCWIGVNATVSNGIRIGDNSKISLGAVVTRDVEANTIVSGNFAIDHRKFINFIKTIR